MKKIKSIKVTNNYILIDLATAGKYKISEDDYFKERYQANMQLSESQFYRLVALSEYHNAYLRALVRIKYQDRTVFEIESLINNEFDLNDQEVHQIIDKLLYYGFLDDKRYCQERIEILHLRNYGINKIKDALKQKGIEQTLIDKYLIYDQNLENDKAMVVAKKAIKSIRNKNQFQSEQTVRNRLRYQGFKTENINNVMNQLTIAYNEEDERKLLAKELTKSYRRYAKKYQGYELRMRLFNQLRNRGFKSELINATLDEMELENE